MQAFPRRAVGWAALLFAALASGCTVFGAAGGRIGQETRVLGGSVGVGGSGVRAQGGAGESIGEALGGARSSETGPQGDGG